MYNGYFCIWKFLQCDPDEVANYIVFPILMIAFYLYVSIYIYIYIVIVIFAVFSYLQNSAKKMTNHRKYPLYRMLIIQIKQSLLQKYISQ